jgi:hypothetical protein
MVKRWSSKRKMRRGPVKRDGDGGRGGGGDVDGGRGQVTRVSYFLSFFCSTSSRSRNKKSIILTTNLPLYALCYLISNSQ